MQETRPEFETRGNPPYIADALADLLQQALVRLVQVDVRQKRQIVTLVEPVEMRPKICRQPGCAVHRVRQLSRILIVGEELDPIAREDGSFNGQRSASFVRVGQLSCRDLTCLHIGLVEWMDAENRAG